jgi:translation elongation factor EF-4
MSFLLNAKPVDALAIIVHQSAQQKVGQQWVKKLRTYHVNWLSNLAGIHADFDPSRQSYPKTTI